MSILKTYNREANVFGDPELGFQWPLYRLNDDLTVNKDLRDFRPGDFVCHVNGGGTGRGIVVAVNDPEIAVLWSTCPQEKEVDFSKFALPPIRRAVSGPLVAKQLVSIQPMTAPVGRSSTWTTSTGRTNKGRFPPFRPRVRGP